MENHLSQAQTHQGFVYLNLIASLLVVLAMVGGGFVGVNAGQLFGAIQDDWRTFDQVSEQKITYLTKIHSALGYSGLTSHLKNWILHNDKTAAARIETDLDAAKISIQSYRMLSISDDESKALISLEGVLRVTERRAQKVSAMLSSKTPPDRIDAYLQADEAVASQALDQLRWAWVQQARAVGQDLTAATEAGSRLITVGALLIPILLSIGVLVLWLIRRLGRQVKAYEMEKRALEASERKFRDLAANVPGVIFQWVERRSGECGYVYVSPRCKEFYGVEPEELTRDWQALTIHPDDEDRYRQTVHTAFEHKSEWSFEGRFLTPNGEPKWWRGVSKPVPVNDDEIVFNGVIIDISTQKKMEEELRALATTDSLTGCSNRRHFMELATKELNRGTRYEESLTVLMLDIDHFKKINDTNGHGCGDKALKGFVGWVKSMLRESDLMGRVGGEEFAVLLPETGALGAFVLADRIRQKVADSAIEWKGGKVSFSVSIGLAEVRRGQEDIERALSRADKALYAAKHAGRDKVISADDLLDEPDDRVAS